MGKCAYPNRPLSAKQRKKLIVTPRIDWRLEFPDHSWEFLRAAKRDAKAEFPQMKTKDLVLGDYARTYAKLGRQPTWPELEQTGLSRNIIRYYYRSFDDLDTAARDAYPEKFPDVQVAKVVAQEIPRAKRYVITTAVNGAGVHAKMLAAVKNYCQSQSGDTKLLIIPCEDPAMRRSSLKGGATLDRALEHEIVVGADRYSTDIPINDNLKLATIKVSAKMKDPSTGLARLANRIGSIIGASPKQRLTMVPTVRDYPRAVMFPGAVTVPDYTTDLYWSLRTAYIAHHDHICGGLVVELADDGKTFHFRQFQADADGSIVDLGKRYRPNGSVQDEKLLSLVFGDLHVGDETPEHRALRYELLARFKPKYVFAHDIFDGFPVNPHEQKKQITRLQHPHLDLSRHLADTWAELKALERHAKVVVPRSNHDEFLDRYLDAYRFDDTNRRIATKLADAMLDGATNPLEWYCKQYRSEEPSQAEFLGPNDSFVLGGVEHGQHGHRGANGSRGGVASLEKCLGTATVGHLHTPEINYGLMVAGTSSRLRPAYAKGPSSWMNSHVFAYPGSEVALRQLINVVDGKYHL